MKIKSLPLLKKQVVILFVFSILVSIGAIIHGTYMDLDFTQIKRLTIEGLLLTVLVIFPAVLFLEWAFDLNNQKQIEELKKRWKRRKKRK